VNDLQRFKKAYNRLRFQTKVMILTSVLIFIIFIALSVYIQSIIAQNIEDEVGQRALAVSNTIAQSQEIIAAFDEDHPEQTIQPLTKAIQEEIGAEFIVVGNTNEVRYSHSHEDRIGKQMVGDDNERALLHGESYASKREGSLGSSIRGKSPIIKDNEIIGVVSVGYLLDDVKEIAREKNQPILFLLITFLGIGILGSIFIAKHLKKLLFNMEPDEIAESFLQKEAILQSTKEGIIAVDDHNRITLLNESAKAILQMEGTSDSEFIMQPLDSVADIPLLQYVEQGQSMEDREVIFGNDIVLMNIFAIKEGMQTFGVVATFRRKTDLEKVTKELSTIKQYTEGLRSQTHEFSNKIHTILGLLELGHHEEAMDFIRQDYDIQTTRHHALIDTIDEPAVQGLLIAKYNQANEKGIDFTLSEDSQLSKLTSIPYRDVILKVLGNMIDNAFHAVKDNPTVTVFMTDIGQDIIIEIDDNGPGIDVEEEQYIFTYGFSTSGEEGRGTGLYLVKQAVTLLNGDVFIEASELKGTRFVIIIPKEGSSHGKI